MTCVIQIAILLSVYRVLVSVLLSANPVFSSSRKANGSQDASSRR
jgi:hypothetical protein